MRGAKHSIGQIASFCGLLSAVYITALARTNNIELCLGSVYMYVCTSQDDPMHYYFSYISLYKLN